MTSTTIKRRRSQAGRTPISGRVYQILDFLVRNGGKAIVSGAQMHVCRGMQTRGLVTLNKARDGHIVAITDRGREKTVT